MAYGNCIQTVNEPYASTIRSWADNRDGTVSGTNSYYSDNACEIYTSNSTSSIPYNPYTCEEGMPLIDRFGHNAYLYIAGFVENIPEPSDSFGVVAWTDNESCESETEDNVDFVLSWYFDTCYVGQLDGANSYMVSGCIPDADVSQNFFTDVQYFLYENCTFPMYEYWNPKEEFYAADDDSLWTCTNNTLLIHHPSFESRYCYEEDTENKSNSAQSVMSTPSTWATTMLLAASSVAGVFATIVM